MSHDAAYLQSRVIEIVSDALAVEAAEVRAHSSLIDDLGAESIDFLDLLFRLESAFQIKIPEQDLWLGALEEKDLESPEAVSRAVERLRARTPQFRWDALPDPVTRQDLPRLITVQTIIDYLERRIAEGTLTLPGARG